MQGGWNRIIADGLEIYQCRIIADGLEIYQCRVAGKGPELGGRGRRENLIKLSPAWLESSPELQILTLLENVLKNALI